MIIVMVLRTLAPAVVFRRRCAPSRLGTGTPPFDGRTQPAKHCRFRLVAATAA
jgi:hypothetical protein